MLFSSQRFHEIAGYHRLLQVDRDDRVIASRTFYWGGEVRQTGDNNAGIAVVGGKLGVQWAPSDVTRPRWFFPIQPAAARSDPFDLEADFAPRVCRPGAPGPVSVLVDAGEQHIYLRGQASLCLQAFELANDLEARHVFAAASPHGDLRTTSYTGYAYQDYRWATP